MAGEDTVTATEFRVGLRYVLAYIDQQQREHETAVAKLASLRAEIRTLRGHLMVVEAMAGRLDGHRMIQERCREALAAELTAV